MSKQHCDQMNQYFKKGSWEFQKEKNIFKCMVVLSDDSPENVFTGTMVVQAGLCTFFISPRFIAQPEYIRDIEQIFTKINAKLPFHTFVLEPSSGWMASKTVLIFDNEQPLQEKLIDELIFGNMQLVGEYFFAIRKLISQEWSPEQVLDHLMNS